jgi:hypothetical protein
MSTENSLDIWLITAIAAAAGGFMGAFGFWLVTKIEEFLCRPRIIIGYGSDYPFRHTAIFERGEKGDFVRVRVSNVGRGAKSVKCFVRHIALRSGGRLTQLPSDELMLTSWVPREANVAIRHIPPKLDFLADVAHTMKVGNEFKVVPVFMVQNQNVYDIFGHVGDFQLEFVVIGENFKTATRTIEFRFDGKSLDLIPLP